MLEREISNEPCPKHGQRYCYDCGRSLVAAPTPIVALVPQDGLEDFLLGRAPAVAAVDESLAVDEAVAVEAAPAAPAVPKPRRKHRRVNPPAARSAVLPLSSVEPDRHPLVQASLRFSLAIEKLAKAEAVVADLEKRLDLAWDDVAEAVRERDSASEGVRNLTSNI